MVQCDDNDNGNDNDNGGHHTTTLAQAILFMAKVSSVSGIKTELKLAITDISLLWDTDITKILPTQSCAWHLHDLVQPSMSQDAACTHHDQTISTDSH